ncbi:BlaI/MecI/CopY family transcriptional regulator [Antrihabitans sp. YC2-6]|nr:BlaI/MecI/CopY family transcriptional regulator [Antrihabitans sp. YC2-6]
MDYLWSANRPTTVREVHELLSADRVLAYTTVMTVMNRLARKNLLVQQRDTRAHRFVPVRGRAELVAEMMVDALHEASEADGRRIALVHFVGKVSADEAAALRRSLAAIEAAEEAS